MNLVVVIPAYNPTARMLDLARSLAAAGWAGVVVVNDGSRPESRRIFAALARRRGVTVLHHAVNLGKGQALKTGLNHAFVSFPQALGVVTLDADGQHLASDALKVGAALLAHPQSLVLGARAFGRGVPLRSRVGNLLTRYAFRFLVGSAIRDTQTGLRGIPRSLVPALLKIETRGYEFELDMLLASKHLSRPLFEVPIRTIYSPRNPTSHFNPIRDSMRIYFVLLRFMLASLLTAGVDYTVFFLIYQGTHGLELSQAGARLLSMVFNYTIVRRSVFASGRLVRQTFPKYALLVAVFGGLSYGMIQLFRELLPINVIGAKMLSEMILFLANFALQRDFIFTRPDVPEGPVRPARV